MDGHLSKIINQNDVVMIELLFSAIDLVSASLDALVLLVPFVSVITSAHHHHHY